MMKLELKTKLDTIGIPQRCYSLNGEDIPGRLVLKQNYARWEVYFFNERGGVDEFRQFENESEACEYLYARLLKLKPYLSTPKFVQSTEGEVLPIEKKQSAGNDIVYL